MEYVTNHLQKNDKIFKCIDIGENQLQIKCNRSIIFIAMPHGIIPFASGLSPLLTRDIFKTSIVSTGASIVFYIPFIRHIVKRYGVRSVSKQSILEIFKENKHVNIVPDGIKGMFARSNNRNNETVLLKYRKGVSKLALQSGTHVVPCFGFGNTECYSSIFDTYGFMQWLSSKLKMSIIIPYGRWFTPIPKKVPLYNVIGKPIYNKYCYQPIQNPTQQQIDEYHQLILDKTKELFDQHKQIYGWNNKQLTFI